MTVEDEWSLGVLMVDPVSVCALLGIEITSSATILVRPTFELPSPPELVLRTGPGEILQVEVVHDVPADLVPRLLAHRAMLMDAYPDDRIRQQVVVTGLGVVTGHDDLEGNGFTLELDVLYLRDEGSSG